MTTTNTRGYVRLSADRRTMTIVTPTPAGTNHITLERATGQGPFTDADVQRALLQTRPRLSEPGQRNITRRWVTPAGTVYLHLMFGPPTWRRPIVECRRGGVTAGWLRAAVTAKIERTARRPR